MLLRKREQKHLMIALQKNKKIGEMASLLENAFDNIYCTTINKRTSMKPAQLMSCFSNNKGNIKKIQNPISIIKKLKTLNENDIACIIGTHYWGPIISKEFKICFD